jgi:hypothetical protein
VQTSASGLPGYFQFPVHYGNFAAPDQLEPDLNIILASRSPADLERKLRLLLAIAGDAELEKFFTDQCLLEQPFIKDASGKTKVRELVDGVNAKTGERIVVKRFARFQVGEGG